MNSFFDSPKAAMVVEKLYHEKLEELDILYEFKKIETSFGDTNIIVTGMEGKPPLVLLHGANGCAPIALEALLGIEKEFRVYAIDVIGQPNLSTATRLNRQDNTYGQWMFEILTCLNLQQVTLVGISFGGFISWKTLTFDEKRIANTFLIVPAGIVNGNPWKVFWKVFLPIQFYKWRKNPKYVQQLVAELFTEKDVFAFDFLSQVLLHFELDFSPIPLITKEEAQTIKTPIHLIVAAEDVFFPGVKMLKRAKAIFPSLYQTLLLQGAKHVPSKTGNQQIIALIKMDNYSTKI